uniref:Uncharacterized protein n=1 Tax=Arundo donax TaxID=35708 RepID=A0A0A9AIR3_ARUDO
MQFSSCLPICDMVW